MARLHLDGRRAHPLGHEPLKVGIDRSIFRRNRIESWALNATPRVRSCRSEAPCETAVGPHRGPWPGPQADRQRNRAETQPRSVFPGRRRRRCPPRQAAQGTAWRVPCNPRPHPGHARRRRRVPRPSDRRPPPPQSCRRRNVRPARSARPAGPARVGSPPPHCPASSADSARRSRSARPPASVRSPQPGFPG
jgi:hypothetical protein